MKIFTMYPAVAVVVLLFTVAYSNRVSAQPSVNTVDNLDSLATFQAIPSNPVFGLLGISGQSIAEPGTISDLLVSLATGVNLQGELSTGYAVSFAPYQMIAGDDLTLNEYNNSLMTRVLTNSQLSFGTASAQGADSAVDWGVGLKIVFANSGDARQDTAYINQLLDQAQALFDRYATPAVGEKVDPVKLAQMTTALKAEIDSLNALGSQLGQDGANPSWNSSFLNLDLGLVYRASQSKVSESQLQKYRATVNGGGGNGIWQLIGQAGVYHQVGFVPGEGDSSFATAALQFRLGTDDFRFGVGTNLEGEFDAFDDSKGGDVNLVAEVRMNKTTWISIAMGREFSAATSPTDWKPSLSFKMTK